MLFDEDGTILCVEPDVFIGQCIQDFDLDSLTQKTLYECIPVSNEETSASQNIDIFPNPAFDEIIIETELLGQLKIFDAQGKCIKRLDHIPSRLNVTDLYQGLYIFSVSYQDQVVTKRFVKM